jgi:outer membrane receptor for monomeric catechols
LETVLANNATFATANNFTKYRANFYGTYSFYRGKLKGLSIGGGTNLVGPAKVGSGATPFNYLYADSYFLLSSNISYNVPLGRRSLRLQVNVNNILDEDEPVTTTFGAYRVGGIAANPPTFAPNGFRLHDPRQFIFSATMTF